MELAYDPAKRAQTLERRGLDFDDARDVFARATIDFIDDRHDYGEARWISFGRLRRRLVVVVWTPRGAARHIISMSKANGREQ
ncbi:MAG: BrnT family toxin [Sphingomicrobium sp.]